ncbi:hypothetical protein M2271_008279 [Streptomyces sp. LBL]|nr:hypothetical protein [Streptomyces sp. LBL]
MSLPVAMAIRLNRWAPAQPAQEQGAVRELGGESVRAARVPPSQGRDLLGERPMGTTVAPAHQTRCSQIESYLPAGDRMGRQTALVVAVHPRGSQPALRTSGRHRQRPPNKTDLGALDCSLLDLHPDTRERNVGNAYRIHHTQVMPTRSRPPHTPKSATEPHRMVAYAE